MSELIRLQVEMTQDQMNELERLQEIGGLRTKKDLLNNAVTLLKWAVREKSRGCAIVSVNEQDGVYKELEMPFLESAATHAAHSTPAPDMPNHQAEQGTTAAGQAKSSRSAGLAVARGTPRKRG